MSLRSPLALLAVVALALCAVAGSPETAEAQSDRPFYLSVGLGPAIGLDDGADTQFKIQEDIGYHLFGFGDSPGVFVGATFSQAFGDFDVFEFGGRVGVGIQILDLGILSLVVVPSVAMGVGIVSLDLGPLGRRSTEAFNFQIAADLRAVLLGGLLSVWVRPLGLDWLIRDEGTLDRYDILFGGAIHL